jgi:hypothetical protein
VDISIALIAVSLHMDALNTNPEGYNQINPGIAIEVNDVDVGVYKNSYKQAASFIAWSPCHGFLRPFAGVVMGYQGQIPLFGKIAPALGLGLEPWHKEGPVITVTPMNLHGVVLSFSWKEKVL